MRGTLRMNDQLLLGITNPTYSHAAAPKDYVGSQIAKIKSSGGGADLSDYLKKIRNVVLPNQPYPVQGNTNKAVSYNTVRAIVLSRKEAFPMETHIDMNSNKIENLGEATTDHEAVNKAQLDGDLSAYLKKDGSVTLTGNMNLGNKQLVNLGFNIQNNGDVVNLGFL